MLTRELSDKVDLVTVSQVSVKCPVTESPHENEGEKSKKEGAMKTRVTKNHKFKCDQCDCTFKKEIPLKKHKNTKHGQLDNKLGEGQFRYVFDVRPGKEDEAEELRE